MGLLVTAVTGPQPCTLIVLDGDLGAAEALELEFESALGPPACVVTLRWAADETSAFITVDRADGQLAWTLDLRSVPRQLKARVAALTARTLLDSPLPPSPPPPAPQPPLPPTSNRTPTGPSPPARIGAGVSAGIRTFLSRPTVAWALALEWNERKWVRTSLSFQSSTQRTPRGLLEGVSAAIAVAVLPFQIGADGWHVAGGPFVETGLVASWASQTVAGSEARPALAPLSGTGGRLEAKVGRFFGLVEAGLQIGLLVTVLGRVELSFSGPFIGVRLGVEL